MDEQLSPELIFNVLDSSCDNTVKTAHWLHVLYYDQAGACWGYYQFFRIDLLEKEGYLLPEEDTITLRFYVRPLTYVGLSSKSSGFFGLYCIETYHSGTIYIYILCTKEESIRHREYGSTFLHMKVVSLSFCLIY